MARQNVSSGSKYEPTIGFSRAVRIGNVIAVSGTKRCIEIAAGALQGAGASLQDVIRTRLFLTDIKQWEAAAKAHGEAFGTIRPACTFVEVKGLIDPNWLVEMEFDAVVEG